jgi:hypothetical protein
MMKKGVKKKSERERRGEERLRYVVDLRVNDLAPGRGQHYDMFIDFLLYLERVTTGMPLPCFCDGMRSFRFVVGPSL